MLKLSLLALALVLALSSAAGAQEGPPDGPKGGEKKDQPRDDQAEMAKKLASFLKEQVELTDEQHSKVEKILRDVLIEAMKRWLARMADPEPPSPQETRKEMEELRDRAVNQIKDVLDDGQKKEFEVLVKDFEKRAGNWDGDRKDPGREATSLFEGERPSKERLLVKTEIALILSEDEKKVILPLVAKICDLRKKLDDGRRDRRKDLDRALHSGASKDEVRERIEIARGRERNDREALEKSQAELRELLTLEQEARLVAIGVLD